ncbi:hypothetical protein NA57DRAFT_79404 [Rhizodiscina lignyota]|uniref:Glycine zipper 2TM domain-containing protein n=1 Tax=Rhizodiscina lignyota TaxID=1504668 RepID=A0A9P4I9M7_9PEZI|nr:hypothetical protein NA57DRAFT_79404 [Rhizodiscina lignyota]
MSGWDEAGELALEGIDHAVDKYYDWAHDGLGQGYTNTKNRIWHKKQKHGQKSQAPDSKPRAKSMASDSRGQYRRDPYERDDDYDDRGYDRGYDRGSRGGDNGYGPPPERGYNYGDRGADDPDSDEERGYRPERPNPYAPPQQPQPRGYNPNRYVPPGYIPPVAGVAAGQVAGALPPPPGMGPARPQPQFLPPPQAYDDGYDSYSEEDDRPPRGARKSKSTNDMRRKDDDDDEGEGKKRPKHSDILITAAGALAGGLLGYEVSNRRGKPESFNMLAGAVVGAVGAHEANKFYEGRKDGIKEKFAKEKDKLTGSKRRDKSRDSKDRYRYDF